MGIMVSFECAACGYETEELGIGLAPHPDEYDPRLVSCAQCRTLRVLDVRDVARGCRRHRCAFVAHDDEECVPCPRCAVTLRCVPHALWD